MLLNSDRSLGSVERSQLLLSSERNGHLLDLEGSGVQLLSSEGKLLHRLQGGQLLLQGVDGGSQVLLCGLQLRHLLQHLLLDAGQVLSNTN